MRRRSLIATLVLAPFAARAVGQVRVVASFSILADFARQVGGDAVSVEALVGVNGDVHVYDPQPKDIRKLTQANLLVRNGLGLEGWMDRLTGVAGDKLRVVVAAGKVIPRTMRENGGSIATDPHAWQNPRNAILYVQAIAEGLVSVDPANATRYRDGAGRYVALIATTDAWIEANFAAIPSSRRRIITTHDAFGYYGARYGIEFLSAEGITTESEPSAKAIATLVRQIKQENVRTVFLENMTNPRIAKMLARETGATLGAPVYSDALSAPDGPAANYLDMLRYNTLLFASAMQPAT